MNERSMEEVIRNEVEFLREHAVSAEKAAEMYIDFRRWYSIAVEKDYETQTELYMILEALAEYLDEEFGVKV